MDKKQIGMYLNKTGMYLKKSLRPIGGYLKILWHYLFITTVMALIWAMSIYLLARSKLTPAIIPNKDNVGSLATLLFGATSIALFILSIIIGGLAVLGWQTIERNINKGIERGIEEKTKSLGNEMRGRVYSSLGHLLGEMSIDRSSLEAKGEEQMEQLEEAINNCQRGYDLLEQVGGPGEFMGLNNLIFYSCIYGVKDNGSLLEKARRMRDAAKKHSGDGANNLLLTAYRAILQYGYNQEITEARSDLSKLIPALTSVRLKREAAIHLQYSPSRTDNLKPSGPKETQG